MTGTAVTQPNYADNGQSGSAYPTAIDAITQVMARIATAFNPHAVPAAAAAPVLSSSAGGSLGARTYYAKITLVTPAGEVTPSAESSLALSANTLLNVASPTFALGVTGWNIYVGTSSGTETKQNSSPIAIGTAWVEPTGGLISGAALPSGLSPMAVIVDAGAVFNNNVLTEKATQSLTFTAPTTNPRIDRIVIDPTTGIASSVAGTEAASPSPPAVPAGKQPVAKVALSVGQTSISNSNITDERVAITPASAAVSNPYAVLNLIAPRADGDWRGIYRGGWRPAFFNQQWGGAQWGNGPDGSLVDFATGQIEHNSIAAVGNAAGDNKKAQAFKVPEAISVQEVWARAYKEGNPTDNLVAEIWSDSAGSPGSVIANGSATGVSGKGITSKTDGEWYKFTFSTPPSLSANTAYWLVMTRSGATDGTNFYRWRLTTTANYPHGSAKTDTGTWAAMSGRGTFLLVPTAAGRFIQSSGQFDGKLVFAEGSPLDQSKGLCQPLRNFFDGREFTFRKVWTGLTKDKTVADFVYGLDHDRVVLRCNATTGYMQVDVYESDGTKHTVTGTTDCSSGTKDIAIYVRAKGDGSDAVKLYVNGASEGTPVSSATITFSTEFRDLGTAWIGGGFPIAPTWTKDTAMGSLPSADGWTWNGAATESAAVSVSGGKLYQNYIGYGATDGGWYQRTTAFSNANGWAAIAKVRVLRDTNTADTYACMFIAHDGTKVAGVHLHEYYIETDSLSTNHKVQVNLTDREHVVLILGKGSDFFVFLDGRLIIDGTGLMTTASASNNLNFLDSNGVSGVNATSIWEYVKDYNTAWLPPQFTAGSLSEAAFFSGDRTGILDDLYNGGTLKSVREYCGIEREYIERRPEIIKRGGVTSSPNTSSSTATLMPEMECFAIGSEITVHQKCTNNHSVAGGAVKVFPYLDGVSIDQGFDDYHTEESAASGNVLNTQSSYREIFCGLHKFEMRFKTDAGGTVTSIGTRRSFVLKSEV